MIMKWRFFFNMRGASIGSRPKFLANSLFHKMFDYNVHVCVQVYDANLSYRHLIV